MIICKRGEGAGILQVFTIEKLVNYIGSL